MDSTCSRKPDLKIAAGRADKGRNQQDPPTWNVFNSVSPRRKGISAWRGQSHRAGICKLTLSVLARGGRQTEPVQGTDILVLLLLLLLLLPPLLPLLPLLLLLLTTTTTTTTTTSMLCPLPQLPDACTVYSGA